MGHGDLILDRNNLGVTHFIGHSHGVAHLPRHLTNSMSSMIQGFAIDDGDYLYVEGGGGGWT